jgi:GNAT superfamily N-acetyltransferase
MTQQPGTAPTTPRAAAEIRPYQAGDRDAVLALAPRLTEWVSGWRDPRAVLAAVRGWVTDAADHADDDGHAFYVAVTAGQAGGEAGGEAGGQVVGLVHVTEQAHFSGQADAYVGELVVAHGWEGHGLGTRLMAAAERWAAGRGLAFICLDTGADNAPARGLYSKLGFADEAVRLTKPVTRPG